ncbi:hypothetical protein DEU32_10819 [Curtobacterium sp. AG1037]|uniref:hypothetical protein n=1 Tax=Curtobacterium sp. AG1037 TaxID=2183990 RepID=UPI000E0C2577|nr:hypothetical protein [Curtobacterium sp. AG1037]RDH96854.1 hypothetical protein DEU32_10819 [Curtobacterium sp. AG1037]
MRNVAAATVLAVAAALLVSAVIALGAAREVATLGLLVGRTSVALTSLPVEASKAERIRTISEAAADADVAVALVVPDRQGDPDRWRAFSFRGTAQTQGLGTALEVRPIGDGADLDLQGILAIDGDVNDVGRFLEQLRAVGYEATDTTPGPVPALLYTLADPAVGAVAAAALLGLVIALVAEAERRGTRQALRLRSGWSPTRIAGIEAADICRVAAPVLVVAVAGTLVLALWPGTGTTARAFTVTVAAVALSTAVLVVVGVHVATTLAAARSRRSAGSSAWAPVVVGAAGAALVALLVADAHAVVQVQTAAQASERTLLAESRHGDDVVLGLGPTAFAQDIELGRIGLAALERDTASMAHASFTDRATLVGEATAALPAVLGAPPAPGGAPVLLVPDALAADADRLADAASADLAAGWAVEERTPPRPIDIEVRRVPSTAAVTEAVLEWTNGIEPALPTWPDIPVLVVPDSRDIALNQIGTAVANGEVRFADRPALERALRQAGLTDTVLQVTRVGTKIERQIGAVRAERATRTAAAVVAGLAVVLAAVTLVQEHRIRTQRSARVRFLVGRHPIVRHRAFVVTAGIVVAVVSGATASSVGTSTAGVLATALLGAVAVSLLLGGVLGVHALHPGDRWRKTW